MYFTRKLLAGICLFFRTSTNLFSFSLSLAIFISSVSEAREIEPVPSELLYCTVCHGTQFSGNSSTEAPGLASLPSWYIKNQLIAFSKAWRGTHTEDISGSEMYPVAVELEAERFDDIAKTIATFVAEPKHEPSILPQDLKKGEQAYQVCAACHGKAAEGNKLLNAPPLTVQGAWYIKKQLLNFKRGLRGYKSEDIYGKTMSASAASLSEEEIDALTAYISTL